MSPTQRRTRVPALVGTVLAVAALVLTACGSDRVVPGDRVTVTRTASSHPTSSKPSSPTSSTPTKPSKPKTRIHVSSLLSDGETYGIGMPIVLFVSPLPNTSRFFTKAVKVTVNGRPANGAWYWEQPTRTEVHKHIVEAHYRMSTYWPAHSTVRVNFPIGGLSAGGNKVFSGRLSSLTFHIGAAHISTVDGTMYHQHMDVTSDGHLVRTIQVSLGAAATPTYNGIKVVMQKGEDTPGTDTLRPDGAVEMIGATYDELVDWSVRMTQSGEYIHAAPWNTHIGQLNTSNGCTNLQVDTAKWFYAFSLKGDVVKYQNTGGGSMPAMDGLGDWMIPWPQWQTGGLFVNHTS